MTPEQRFRIHSPRVINEVLDGEAVIIHLDTGYYYSLDAPWSEVWESIGRGRSIARVARSLAGRYRGTRPEIEEVVGRLLASLLEEDLIRVDDGLPEAADGAEAEAPSAAGQPAEAARDGQEAGGGEGDRPPLPEPVLHKYTDMQDLLLLDPIHEVEETGWPERKAADR